MSPKPKPATEVKLWKENKISGEYTMSIAEFKAQFFEWLKKQNKDWCNRYGTRAAVCEFIGKELKSAASFDPYKNIDDYTELSILVDDEFWNIVDNVLT